MVVLILFSHELLQDLHAHLCSEDQVPCSCAEVAVTRLCCLQLLFVVSSCLCYPVGLTHPLWWLSSLVLLWNCWEHLIQAGPSMSLVPVFPRKASSCGQGGRPRFHSLLLQGVPGVLSCRSWPRETVGLQPEICTELVFYPVCLAFCYGFGLLLFLIKSVLCASPSGPCSSIVNHWVNEGARSSLRSCLSSPLCMTVILSASFGRFWKAALCRQLLFGLPRAQRGGGSWLTVSCGTCSAVGILFSLCE